MPSNKSQLPYQKTRWQDAQMALTQPNGKPMENQTQNGHKN